MEKPAVLSIIIPIYNEEESILPLHENLRQVLEKQNLPYEVIYVDDGSTDGTFPQLYQLARSDQHIRRSSGCAGTLDKPLQSPLA